MKKLDLAKKVTTKVEGLTQDTAGKTINAIFEVIAEALESGDSYTQDKFGAFKIVKRAARKGRNPKTGEIVDIPAKNTVKFTISDALKTKINEE